MSDFKIVKLLDKMQIVNIPSGLVPKGPYDDATDYAVGDVVSYYGSSYILYADVAAGTEPTNQTYWQILTQAGTGISDTKITVSPVAPENPVQGDIWIKSS
jgi:hypothetical protein